MTTTSRILAVSALLALPACSSTPGAPPQTSDGPSEAATPIDVPAETPSAPTEDPPTSSTKSSTDPGATSSTCRDGEFVACHDGKACTMKGGAFLTEKVCFQTAAAACDAASCKHGCDLYLTHLGGPKLALCAVNASSTGHMLVCGGLANWTCPENMHCEISAGPALDASGTCVPDRHVSK